MAFQYLFAPTTQFQARTGANNTAGFLRVFYTQTDDRAVTYSDFGGTENEADIVLDNDGRAVVIVDDSKTYRLEVYGVNRNLLFTVDPLTAVGGGSGGANITNVVSTDGTVAITVTSIGGVVTYDLSTAFEDNPSSWGNALSMISDLDGTDQWVQIPVVSSVGSSLYDNGWTAGKDTGYDIAASVEMPTGSNTAIYGIDVKCEVQVDGVTVLTELGRIDPTTPMDRVSFEWKGELTKGQKVDAKLYVKNGEAITLGLVGRALFNEECDGIVGGGGGNEYIPGEYIDISTANVISVTGVQPLSGMSSYVPYSSIGGNADSQITGINGSAIAVPFDSATVSSIASSVASAYTESAFSSISSWTAEFSSISSKADQSALTAYQPVSAMSAYATEAYVDAAVGDKLDASASSLFLTGLPDDLATTGDVASAVSGKLDKSASGEFYPMTGNPSGFLTAHQSLAGYATEQYVDSAVSSKLDTSAFASASAGFAPTGDYAYNSSLYAYYPASASGAFQLSGNYQTAGDYALNSAVSAKLDASASSSFVVNSSMSAWIPYSALDYSGTAISGIGGSSLAGMGGGGADYSGVYPVNVDNTAREISVDSLPLVTDSSMTAYGSAGSSVIGVNLDIMSGKLDSSAQVVTATAVSVYAGTSFLHSVNGNPISAVRAGQAANASMATSAYYDGTGRLISSLPDSAAVSAIASAYAEIAASSKLDESATADFYSTSNPSGFITGVDLSNYATTAYVDSSISSFVDSAYVESQVSGKQDTLTFDWDADSAISSINGSALGGQGGASIVVTGTAWDPDTSAYVYNLTSNLSAAERNVWTWQNGGKQDYINYFKDDSGNRFPMLAFFLEAGAEQMYYGGLNGDGRLQFSPKTTMFSADGSNKYGLSPLTYATGASMNLSAGYFRASYRGDTIFISRGPSGTIDSSNSSQIKAVRIEAHTSRGANISAYGASATGYYGDTGMKLSHTGVFVDDSGNSSNTAASAMLTTGSLKFYSAGSSDTMSQSSIPYWNAKLDSSAFNSSDFQQVTGMSAYALSADVSATVDIVGTQSANWGGSALQLSAGAGISLTLSGNVLIIATAGA